MRGVGRCHPSLVILRRKDHRHSIVDRLDEFIRVCGNDGVGLQRLSRGLVLLSLPESSKMRRVNHPSRRLAYGCFVFASIFCHSRLCVCVDSGKADFGIFRPIWEIAPNRREGIRLKPADATLCLNCSNKVASELEVSAAGVARRSRSV